MDETDIKILIELKNDSKSSMKKISKKTGIPSTTVYDRIVSLKKKGIIRKYTIELDNEKLGKGVAAYVLLSLDATFLRKKHKTDHNVADEVAKFPFVEEVSVVTGRADLIARINVKDTKDLSESCIQPLKMIPGVLKTETFLAMYIKKNN